MSKRITDAIGKSFAELTEARAEISRLEAIIADFWTQAEKTNSAFNFYLRKERDTLRADYSSLREKHDKLSNRCVRNCTIACRSITGVDCPMNNESPQPHKANHTEDMRDMVKASQCGAAPVAWQGVGMLTGRTIIAIEGEPMSEKCGPWIPLYPPRELSPGLREVLESFYSNYVDDYGVDADAALVRLFLDSAIGVIDQGVSCTTATATSGITKNQVAQ